MRLAITFQIIGFIALVTGFGLAWGVPAALLSGGFGLLIFGTVSEMGDDDMEAERGSRPSDTEGE